VSDSERGETWEVGAHVVRQPSNGAVVV